MNFTIKKATKQQARLRMALIGPSGSGKTYSALEIATRLGQRVIVIDTERGSASKYADLFAFDVLELETFEPRTYVAALRACTDAGADVVVVDSLSHAWIGKGGALEQVDRAAKRQGGNSFGAWRDVTPQHNELVDAMLRTDAHLIVTMRAKTEFVQERDERTGRTVVRKVGLAPVQRDGLEYEFDVVADVNHEHEAVITKSRCAALSDAIIPRPGEALARTLSAWLSDGVARELAPAKPSTVAQREEPQQESQETERPEVPAQLALFCSDCEQIELPGEAVAVWIKHRASLSKLPSADRESAWKVLCARTEEVGRMKNAKVWLKKCIAEEDARTGQKSPGDALLDDVRSSASIKGTVRDLADLWRAMRAEIESIGVVDSAWKVIADRALALKLTPAAVRAEVDRLDRNDRGPQGPNGGRKPTGTGGAASARGEGAEGAAANDGAMARSRDIEMVTDAAQRILDEHGRNPWALRNSMKKHRADLRETDVAALARALVACTPADEDGAELTKAGAESIVRGLMGLRRAA